jgi:hypothetical protein
MRPTPRTSLLHLIYFSRLNLSADPSARSQQIDDLARQCQKKNEFHVITSFLFVDQNFAVQVIEGERNALIETFNRINVDPRHRDVKIVEWREIAKRDFGQSFALSVRGPVNDALYAKANLLPTFQRGTPKAAGILSLAQQLQAESLSRQGGDPMLV